MKIGIINYNAIGTWLEPYIQLSFNVLKITNTSAIILIDYGRELPVLKRISKRLLDINP